MRRASSGFLLRASRRASRPASRPARSPPRLSTCSLRGIRLWLQPSTAPRRSSVWRWAVSHQRRWCSSGPTRSISSTGSWLLDSSCRARPAARAMVVGAVALVLGLALAVTAVAMTAPTLFFAGTAVTGVGFGVAWLGVLRSLVSLASPTGRAALLAAIFVVAYVAFALPAVVAGFLVTLVGLHDAALWYGGAVGLLALAGLAGSVLINRPASR